MYYASFGILALILHFIINSEILRKRSRDLPSMASVRYRQFLLCVTVYYITDILWGFLDEARIAPLVYADTVLYFLSMALSILLWLLYVVAFIDMNGAKSRALTFAGYGIFGFMVLCIIVNFFSPVIFSYDSVNGYSTGSARYFVLVIQILMHTVLSVYSLVESTKLSGKEKVHYVTVGVSGAGMATFIVLQALFPLLPFYAVGLLVSNCLIHVFVEEDRKKDMSLKLDSVTKRADQEREISEMTRLEKETYNNIANSLAEDYDAIYYIEIESGKYREFSASDLYRSMMVPKMGLDFYSETLENVKRFVHPDDRDFARSLYNKKTMLKNLEGRKSYSYKYRIMINGETRYFRFIVMLAEDKKHFVLCDKDINDDITAEKARKEFQKKHATFGQIAESLASNYDVIYYVDIENGDYVAYTTRNIYGQLEVNDEGDDFFREAEININRIIHPEDRVKMQTVLTRDNLLSSLDDRKQYDMVYRQLIDGKVQNTRTFIRRSSDNRHFIIGVENIDDEVMKEREQLKALNTEKELARRDELTGVKNKTAYSELERSVQGNIDNGLDYLPFAIAVCDINDLKQVNDTEGHKAGDDYIRAASRLLCNVFSHSPVFRIGGDEFAVFLRGDDYTNRMGLIQHLKEEVKTNSMNNCGPVVALGMSEFKPGEDTRVLDVFERADTFMYEDKRIIKECSTVS